MLPLFLGFILEAHIYHIYPPFLFPPSDLNLPLKVHPFPPINPPLAAYPLEAPLRNLWLAASLFHPPLRGILTRDERL